MTPTTNNPTDVIKRAFWLAWQAAGGPMGYGFLQDNPGANEEEVWQNVQNAGDYPGGNFNRGNQIYGDYVFGRMLKLSLTPVDGGVKHSSSAPEPSYQGWAISYPTYESLIIAADSDLTSDDVTTNQSERTAA